MVARSSSSRLMTPAWMDTSRAETARRGPGGWVRGQGGRCRCADAAAGGSRVAVGWWLSPTSSMSFDVARYRPSSTRGPQRLGVMSKTGRRGSRRPRDPEALFAGRGTWRGWGLPQVGRALPRDHTRLLGRLRGEDLHGVVVLLNPGLANQGQGSPRRDGRKRTSVERRERSPRVFEDGALHEGGDD